MRPTEWRFRQGSTDREVRCPPDRCCVKLPVLSPSSPFAVARHFRFSTQRAKQPAAGCWRSKRRSLLLVSKLLGPVEVLVSFKIFTIESIRPATVVVRKAIVWVELDGLSVVGNRFVAKHFVASVLALVGQATADVRNG